jgi:23S rRNA (guanosine2251-2'-O)-methyltransferase
MQKHRSIVLVAHNLRSCHNVGSLLRTAEGLGVDGVICTGYTPYPLADKDTRLPHLAQKQHRQISKTALGAEEFVSWSHDADVAVVFARLRSQGYKIVALEQAAGSVSLPDFRPPEKLALVVGREADGIEPEVLTGCDYVVEIPMRGQKESFNVVQAAAMALYAII